MKQTDRGMQRGLRAGIVVLGGLLAWGAEIAAEPYAGRADGVLDAMLLHDGVDACRRAADADQGGCDSLPDSDGDGATDDIDPCPDTPQGSPVDAHGCPPDADRDGVADRADKCPDTQYGVRVDGRGCPLDLDGDGVPYYLDRCPTTPPGAEVDAEGCTLKRAMEEVQFALDRADLSPAGRALLDQMVTSLGAEPGITALRVTGHSDSLGPPAYNQRLSEARAQTVEHYLKSHGVTQPITAIGLGATRPAASNAGPEGRARNRRVEIQPVRERP